MKYRTGKFFSVIETNSLGGNHRISRSDPAALPSERKPQFEVLDLISFFSKLEPKTFGEATCHTPCYLSKQGIRLFAELQKTRKLKVGTALY
jgi:hypothetical protein